MKIDGQCHCGHVTYEAEIDPALISICHCTDCQMLTGTAFRVTAPTARENVRLTGNAPKIYTKFGDNGNKRLQMFCPECGSPLFTTGEGPDAAEWAIRVGSITQRRTLAPTRQAWCVSALPWVEAISTLPKTSGD